MHGHKVVREHTSVQHARRAAASGVRAPMGSSIHVAIQGIQPHPQALLSAKRCTQLARCSSAHLQLKRGDNDHPIWRTDSVSGCLHGLRPVQLQLHHQLCGGDDSADARLLDGVFTLRTVNVSALFFTAFPSLAKQVQDAAGTYPLLLLLLLHLLPHLRVWCLWFL